MILRKTLLILLGLSFFAALGFAYQTSNLSIASLFNTDSTETTNNPEDKSTIQVALLLDTSGSMSGLIEQAKSQLWNILNELARTEKDTGETSLEIALYEYGNPSKTKNINQVNQLVPFTEDMDLISEKLFALRTSGGEEYCGTVIQTSLDQLEWKNEDGLKIIYIAGNEEFTQGMISYTSACEKAKEKGITINTIYCGDYQEGIKEYWLAGATTCGGDYLNINHNKETVYVPTPYDDEINRLNNELNKTYIPINEKAKSKKQNQLSQDSNAGNYSKSNIADRAVFKSSKKYKATEWDLVDAYKKDKSIVKNKAIMSDTLQALSVSELEYRIEVAATQRSAINQQIQDLDKKRRNYKENNAKNTKDASLQKSMIKTIQKQAKKKGYKTKD